MANKALFNLLQPLSQEKCTWLSFSTKCLKSLIIAVFLLIPACSLQNAFAFDAAIKLGYTSYAENRPSEYVDNTCYDSEISYGGFLRFVKDNWIARLDIDYNETGNTFLNPIGIAYEQVNLRQRNFSLSFGSYFFKYLYALVGATYTQNEGNIEQYTAHPFDYEFKNSLAPSATIGIEKSMGRFFTFLEYRKIWSEMEVRIKENIITEDTGNSTVFFGIGVKW